MRRFCTLRFSVGRILALSLGFGFIFNGIDSYAPEASYTSLLSLTCPSPTREEV